MSEVIQTAMGVLGFLISVFAVMACIIKSISMFIEFYLKHKGLRKEFFAFVASKWRGK